MDIPPTKTGHLLAHLLPSTNSISCFPHFVHIKSSSPAPPPNLNLSKKKSLKQVSWRVLLQYSQHMSSPPSSQRSHSEAQPEEPV